MATANLPVPDQMNCADGEASANWEFFLEQWQNYNVATGLAKKDKEIQAATLATVMGRECYTVLKNLELITSDRKDLEQVLEALTKHFTPKKNVIYERYVFGTYTQRPNN